MLTKAIILVFTLIIVSILWIRYTARFLTKEQIINRDYPLWIMLPADIIYFGMILEVILILAKFIVWVVC